MTDTQKWLDYIRECLDAPVDTQLLAQPSETAEFESRDVGFTIYSPDMLGLNRWPNRLE